LVAKEPASCQGIDATCRAGLKYARQFATALRESDSKVTP